MPMNEMARVRHNHKITGPMSSNRERVSLPIGMQLQPFQPMFSHRCHSQRPFSFSRDAKGALSPYPCFSFLSLFILLFLFMAGRVKNTFQGSTLGNQGRELRIG